MRFHKKITRYKLFLGLAIFGGFSFFGIRSALSNICTSFSYTEQIFYLSYINVSSIFTWNWIDHEIGNLCSLHKSATLVYSVMLKYVYVTLVLNSRDGWEIFRRFNKRIPNKRGGDFGNPLDIRSYYLCPHLS